jgi:hypothetical protein
VCAIDGTTVVIGARSGAIAAALRHIAPRLLAELRTRCNSLIQNGKEELTGIRIEVQVEVPAPKRVVRARSPMPIEQLRKVAEGLADSPLKETLEDLGDSGKTRARARAREKPKG